MICCLLQQQPILQQQPTTKSMYLSIITPGCNFPLELIIRPPAATTNTASCTARNLLKSRKSANKKSIRFKRHFSNRKKKILQKNYCRLISQSNIKNARSIDLPAGNPPGSERGYIGSKQARGAAVRERERASERARDRAGLERPCGTRHSGL